MLKETAKASETSANTNQMTGAEAVVRMLQHHGVQHIFGLCGDTSLPFYDALHRLDHGMTHILTRDERSAAYMADVYARVSGRVGVCEGPSGGGATYILPGLVEADESSIPVLGITTDIGVGGRGRYTLTELDQESLFRPVTKWNRMIDQAAQIPGVIRTAFREMTTGKPGAAHIGLPFDVQKQPVNQDDIWADSSFGQYPALPASPSETSLDEAAELLLSAHNPLIICGGGPVNAGAFTELTGLAEALSAPVATSVSGKGIISETHPLAMGVVGSNGGTVAARELLDAADVILLVGCRAGSVTTERWRHPRAGGCKIIHIDSDPRVIGANYPTDVAVIGDARPALRGLLERTKAGGASAKERKKEVEAKIAALQIERFRQFDELAALNDGLVRPERIVSEMSALLPEDAVVVADPGTPCPYTAAYYRLKNAGRHFVTNRAHGALGYAMPGSLGAYYGRPGAKIVAFVGDGSFGFNAGELETLVRSGAPITVVVVSNSVFGWIKAGQKSGFGQRYFSVDFDRTDHARVAEAYGLRSWSVRTPEELRPALQKAFEAEGPTLVDVIAQPLHEAAAPVTEWVA